MQKVIIVVQIVDTVCNNSRLQAYRGEAGCQHSHRDPEEQRRWHQAAGGVDDERLSQHGEHGQVRHNLRRPQRTPSFRHLNDPTNNRSTKLGEWRAARSELEPQMMGFWVSLRGVAGFQASRVPDQYEAGFMRVSVRAGGRRFKPEYRAGDWPVDRPETITDGKVCHRRWAGSPIGRNGRDGWEK